MRTGLVTWVALFILALASAVYSAEPAVVDVIHLPNGALVPDVAVDPAGTMHMVYGLGDHAWYVQSRDDGKTFTRPVRVNSTEKVSLTMGERGPKISLGKDNSIHVIWADRWSPGVKVYARYCRSLDGGKTFEPAKQISPVFGIDGLTMAADGEGNVAAFWHVMDPPQKEIPQATWLYGTFSKDNGATFSQAERLKIAGQRELACSMCLMRARMGSDGNVYLVFRAADNNIRDFYVLRSPKGENRFTPLRVNEDNWKLTTCPMCGPELTFDAAGRALCAFMTRHRVYWAALDAGASQFKLHVATPANENDEIYPAAFANFQGQVLMVWQIGPMSTTGRATVKWAIYDKDGHFSGQQGTLGVTTSGTKATAFVGKDERFHIVTTAR